MKRYIIIMTLCLIAGIAFIYGVYAHGTCHRLYELPISPVIFEVYYLHI